jgi:hypothetical protein
MSKSETWTVSASTVTNWPPDHSLHAWRTSRGDHHDFGLFRRRKSAGLWASVRLRWWFGLTVRWDPDIMGSKVSVTFFDQEIGWLE